MLFRSVYFVQDNWYRERGPGREVNHAYREGYREGYRDDRGQGDDLLARAGPD